MREHDKQDSEKEQGGVREKNREKKMNFFLLFIVYKGEGYTSHCAPSISPVT